MVKRFEHSAPAAISNQVSTGVDTSVTIAEAAGSKSPAGRPNRGSREFTKLIGGHFHPDVARQMRIIAAEEGTTVQALLAEALDLLFVKKGKAKIAASSRHRPE